MLRLAQKAFEPAKIPFPLLHIDTGYKFAEMIEFRDRIAATSGAEMLVYKSQDHLIEPADPFRLGTQRCCAQLKTKPLLDALRQYGFVAAIGGARREEEKSRAKERIYSIRDQNGQWNPKTQRPEVWNLLNSRLPDGHTMRVFPLSNWTELDVWEYILGREHSGCPALFRAKNRRMFERGELLIAADDNAFTFPGETAKDVMCRMRSLGCIHCTGAVRSTASTVREIIEEVRGVRKSERQFRAIDHDEEGSMETKKREGYF